jgi:hypothetical protein
MTKYFVTEVRKIFLPEATLQGQLAATQEVLKKKDVTIKELRLEVLRRKWTPPACAISPAWTSAHDQQRRSSSSALRRRWLW